MQVLAQRVLTFLRSFCSCSQKYKKVWHFLRKTLDICLRFGYNNTRRQGHGPRRKEYADVAELADALDSGSSSLKRVWVQIPSSAPKSSNVCSGIFCFSDLLGMTSIVPRGAGGSRFSAIDTATAPVLHWNRGCTILHPLYAMKSGRGLARPMCAGRKACLVRVGKLKWRSPSNREQY